MGQELGMEVRQKLALNREMLQSVDVLQMAALELKDYVETAALENPLIDFQEWQVGENDSLKAKLERQAFSREENHTYEQQGERLSDEDAEDIWNMIGTEQQESLEDFLRGQLMTQCITADEEKIFHIFIEALDEKGYLPYSPEELAGQHSLELESARNVLERLQSLEPAGVGARNLKECLLLQLFRYYPTERLAQRIVSEYLELLGENQIPRIAKKCGCTIGEVTAAIEVIRRLEPRPGRAFVSGDLPAYIIPDVMVVKFQENYEILLNEFFCPHVCINDYYFRMLKETQEEEIKDYLSEKYRRALWIQECIRKREKTILEITKSVVRRQNEFFATGKGIKVLLVRELAEEAGLSESTVSRTIKGKYLQCTWGIYPLRFFFRGTVGERKEGDTSFTAIQVQEAIKALLAGEDKNRPLSDQRIMEYLAGQNMVVSRRAIAKYRNQLHIPDARHRKQYPT